MTTTPTENTNYIIYNIIFKLKREWKTLVLTPDFIFSPALINQHLRELQRYAKPE